MSARNRELAGQAANSSGNEDDSRLPLLSKARVKSASTSHKISLLLQDWWLWELSSALTATLATSAIIVILVVYDGSPLPDWPSVITVRRWLNLTRLPC